jgi:hypothetical protein
VTGSVRSSRLRSTPPSSPHNSKVPPPTAPIRTPADTRHPGLRKATALTGDDVHLSLEPSAQLGPLQARLLALCNARAPRQFPDLSVLGNPGANASAVNASGSTATVAGGASAAPPIGSTGGRLLAEAVVAVFTAAVPPEVAARHALDDLDELAQDIERCLHKGAEEYVKSL